MVAEHGELVEAPASWSGATYSANLRLAAHQRASHAAVIPGNMRERQAWTTFAESVMSTRFAYETYMERRSEAGTNQLLVWEEVEATLRTLQALIPRVERLTTPPLEQF